MITISIGTKTVIETDAMQEAKTEIARLAWICRLNRASALAERRHRWTIAILIGMTLIQGAGIFVELSAAYGLPLWSQCVMMGSMFVWWWGWNEAIRRAKRWLSAWCSDPLDRLEMSL